MKLKTLALILAVITLPAIAHAQAKKGEPAAPPKPTKADAAKVIKMVSADKAKTATYCEIVKLGEQIEQADQKKDTKKVEELAQKADDLGGKIGPEYVALIEGLQEMDPSSKDGQEIGTMLEALDKLCGK
ncbi:MAG: hypothetical protein ABI830_09445 [Pseudolabrys sp.]